MATTSTTLPSEQKSTLGKRIAVAATRLLPRRTDWLLFACCLIVAIGLLDPFLEQQLYMNRGGHHLGIGRLWLAFGYWIASLGAVAIAWGWRRLEIRTGAMIVAATGISFAAFSWAISEVTNTWKTDSEFYWRNQPDWRLFENQSTLQFTCLAIALAAVGFLLVFLVTRGFVLLLEKMKSSTNRKIKLSRSKILIGLAVIMLAAKLVQDAFFPMGFMYSIKAFAGNGAFGKVGISAIGFVALILIPSWLLTSRAKWRWKLLFLIVTASIAIAGLVARDSVMQSKFSVRIINAIMVSFIFVFYGSLLLISKPLSDSTSSARQGISLWSFVPLAALMLFASATYWLDATMLSTSYGENWYRAYLAKKISRASEYKVSLTAVRGGIGVVGEINDETPTNLFLDIKGQGVNQIELKGLTPEFDVSNLYGLGFVFLSDSKLRTDQLQGLVEFADPAQMSNVEVVDPDGTITCNAVSQFTVAATEKHGFESVLNSFGKLNCEWIRIRLTQEALTTKNLDAVVEFSKKHLIFLNQESIEFLIRQPRKEGASLKNIIFEAPADEIADPTSRAFKFALETDVTLKVDGNAGDFAWDLAFAKNFEASHNYWTSIKLGEYSNPAQLLADSNRYHWNFSGESTTNVTHLFLPGIETSFMQDSIFFDVFKDVEVLSMDPRWLSSDDPRTRYYRKNGMAGIGFNQLQLAGLENLTELKRLDLNSWVAISDDNFTSRIPKIEYLQIRFSNDCKEFVDFSVCKNLKTLIYFGIPPKSTIAQLSKLKNKHVLKSVTVITSAADILSTAELNRIRNSIPGLPIKMESESDFKPTPPDIFIQHVKERSAQIRKKHGVQNNADSQ